MLLLPYALITTIVLSVQTKRDGAHDLDFWLGTWELQTVVTQPDGSELKGKAVNVVKRILGEKVIQENFDMPSLKGISVSSYNAVTGVWKQTWVDDQGGYIPLTGGKDGDAFVLTTLPNPNRPGASNRMTFYNITKNSFDWKWEASTNDGKSWKTTFAIRYEPKKGSK